MHLPAWPCRRHQPRGTRAAAVTGWTGAGGDAPQGCRATGSGNAPRRSTHMPARLLAAQQPNPPHPPACTRTQGLLQAAAAGGDGFSPLATGIVRSSLSASAGAGAGVQWGRRASSLSACWLGLLTLQSTAAGCFECISLCNPPPHTRFSLSVGTRTTPTSCTMCYAAQVSAAQPLQQ